MDVLLGVYAVLDLNVALRSEVEWEDHHDGGEHDDGTPRVLRPSSRYPHARVRLYLAIGWVQEVYEGRGDDDTGAEVAGKEVDVEGDAESGNSFGDDGEEGRAGGDDRDDEEGRDTGAELAVVSVG